MNNANEPDSRCDAFDRIGQEGRIARMSRMINPDEQIRLDLGWQPHSKHKPGPGGFTLPHGTSAIQRPRPRMIVIMLTVNNPTTTDAVQLKADS